MNYPRKIINKINECNPVSGYRVAPGKADSKYSSGVTNKFQKAIAQYVRINEHGIVEIESNAKLEELSKYVLLLFKSGLSEMNVEEYLFGACSRDRYVTYRRYLEANQSNAFMFTDTGDPNAFVGSRFMRLLMNRYRELIVGNTYFLALDSGQELSLKSFSFNKNGVFNEIRAFIKSKNYMFLVENVLIHPDVEVSLQYTGGTLNDISYVNFKLQELVSSESSGTSTRIDYQIYERSLVNPVLVFNNSVYKGHSGSIYYNSTNRDNLSINANFKVIGILPGNLILVKRSNFNFNSLKSSDCLKYPNEVSLSSVKPLLPIYTVGIDRPLEFYFQGIITTPDCNFSESYLKDNKIELKVTTRIIIPGGTERSQGTNFYQYVFNTSNGVFQGVFQINLPASLVVSGKYSVMIDIVNPCGCKSTIEYTFDVLRLEADPCCSKSDWIYSQSVANDVWHRMWINGAHVRYKITYKRYSFAGGFSVSCGVEFQSLQYNGWQWKQAELIGAEVYGELWSKLPDGSCEQRTWDQYSWSSQHINDSPIAYAETPYMDSIHHLSGTWMLKNSWDGWAKLHWKYLYIEIRQMHMPEICDIYIP